MMLRLLLLLLLQLLCHVDLSFSQPFRDSSYYYEHWCGGMLRYLDDRFCTKKFPNNYDREWSCRISTETSIPDGFQPDVPFEDIKVDTETLKITSTEEVDLCVVITKFVQDVGPVNKYYCLGEHSRQTPFETWSSSKIFAIANAAGTLHMNESSCGDMDGNWVYGLDSSTTSSSSSSSSSARDKPLHLGDLISIICSYDHTANYTSNALSSYFHDIGWRWRLHDEVLHKWLGAPDDQSLGGNYGEPTPDDLSFVLRACKDQLISSCLVEKDPNEKTYSNSISALTAVEMLRRLVLHREISENMQFPGVTWEDVSQILYGAGEKSLQFPGQLWVIFLFLQYVTTYTMCIQSMSFSFVTFLSSAHISHTTRHV